MPAYRMLKTRIHLPTSEPVPNSPVSGERVVTDGVRVLEGWGHLRPLKAELATTPFGQAARKRFRWRGQLPDGVEPEPGWTVETGEARYRITSTLGGAGFWTLDLEEIG